MIKIRTTSNCQKTMIAGIGATGSAKARFFHPSQKIRDQWPNEYQTKQLTGVLIVGKGVHRVNRRDQLCYEFRIMEIDDNTVFHIVCSNFKVETCALIAFEDEVAPTATVVVPATQDIINQRVSVDDVDPNVNCDLAIEIDDLRQQGIEVDDNNEPAPENAEPPPQATNQVGEWITPTICPRREVNCSNCKGSWKRLEWTVV